MPASIGVNLRVTGHCSQGGRKYMEDLFSVAYQQTEDERDLEYAFFGIYDGHGGSEAAAFAKEHLMDSIVKQRLFWSDNDEDVLKAIRNGYMLTHLNMWKELEKWPKTVTGLPSTAGTTASIAFIRRGKIYIGHVGDSAIILGYQKEGSEEWAAKPLTSDHKPESTIEIERIQRCGGKVVSKAGVPRVVWNRPRVGHKGPIKKNTPMDEIPFLAVARSLGDLWSYNPQNDEFIVSPDPDVGVLTIDPTKFRCLIFGTDGLWNMISPEGAVSLVQSTERHNEAALVGGTATQPRDWLNPSKSLVDHALERWSNTRMRADNTSVVTLMLDPPGPPRATVLRSRTTQKPQAAVATNTADAAAAAQQKSDEKADTVADANGNQVPQNGLTIMTRYSDADKPAAEVERAPLPPVASLDNRFSLAHEDAKAACGDGDDDAITNYGNPAESYFMARLLNRSRVVNTLSDVYDEIVRGKGAEPDAQRDAVEEAEPEATALPEPDVEVSKRGEAEEEDDGGIQINEVSSSSPVEGPPRRGRRTRDAPAPHDRVLRSHHSPPPAPPRAPKVPNTRARPQPAPAPSPAPTTERVVILSRRAPPRPPEPERLRATRSSGPAGATISSAAAPATSAVPLAQKITRSISGVVRAAGVATAVAATGARAGNSHGAPGPARTAPAAQQARPAQAPARGSKENRGARARRSRADVADPAPRSASAEPVHSTTDPHPSPPPLRALRSRNDACPPPKRRCSGPPPPCAKAPRLAPERVARAVAKRASGPWAPALALRNRLRKRLAK